MMSFEDADRSIGAAVEYSDGHGTREHGIIVRTNSLGVFVRYGTGTTALTNPHDLRLLS